MLVTVRHVLPPLPAFFFRRESKKTVVRDSRFATAPSVAREASWFAVLAIVLGPGIHFP